MKAQPLKNVGEGLDRGYVACQINEVEYLHFKFANEEGVRILPVQVGGRREGTRNWSWNGDCEKPTLKPSIATNFGGGLKCHVWLNDGRVQHLSDCTCGLAGQVQDLDDVEPL